MIFRLRADLRQSPPSLICTVGLVIYLYLRSGGWAQKTCSKMPLNSFSVHPADGNFTMQLHPQGTHRLLTVSVHCYYSQYISYAFTCITKTSAVSQNLAVLLIMYFLAVYIHNLFFRIFIFFYIFF